MMNAMKNRDAVIRHASVAAENHATQIRNALALLLTAADPAMVDFATERLRDALVTLSVGHEVTCGNGSTYATRKAAAVSALAAWDGAPHT